MKLKSARVPFTGMPPGGAVSRATRHVSVVTFDNILLLFFYVVPEISKKKSVSGCDRAIAFKNKSSVALPGRCGWPT